MGVQIKIEPWRPSLDPAQQQMLDGVVAGRSSAYGILHGGMHLVSGEGLKQPEHPHELSLALPAHPRLLKTPQLPVLLGQIPSGEWCRLIQSAGLLLQQRQVVQWVEYEVVVFVRAPVTGYHVGAAAYDHLIDVAPHKYVPVSECNGHRVVSDASIHIKRLFQVFERAFG